MSPLRYFLMVFWSFFGIRRSAGAREELLAARPIPLLLVALVTVAAFVAFLVMVATFAVSRLS